MNATTFAMTLSGIVALACGAGPEENCSPCPATSRHTTCDEKIEPIAEPEILAFEADWCRPCREMSPVLDELKEQGVRIRRIDVDRNKALVQEYRVTSLPTLVKLVGGKETARLVGLTSPAQVGDMVETSIRNAATIRPAPAVCPAAASGAGCCCREGQCKVPAAKTVEPLLRARYEVPQSQATALVELLEQTTTVSVETDYAEGHLTITTTPAAQRTIGGFIDAFLRDAPE